MDNEKKESICKYTHNIKGQYPMLSRMLVAPSVLFGH